MEYLYLILNWMFGILFLFLGLILIINDPILCGLLLIAMALLLLPPVRKYVYSKTNIEIPIKARAIFLFALLIIYSICLVKYENKKDQELIIQKAKEKVLQEAQDKQKKIENFKENRDSIITSIKTLLDAKEYEKAISQLNKYLFSEDEELKQLNSLAKTKLVEKQKVENNIPLLSYDVIDSDTYDAPIKTQITLHAVVSGKISELGLRQLLQKLYDKANATRDFKYNDGKPTHVFVYLYTSQDHFKSGMGQWIAMLSKVGENARIETQVQTDLIAQLDAKPEVKHGLSESKRKEIFIEIVMAQDIANSDAKRMYPLPDPAKPGYSQTKAGELIIKQAEASNTFREIYELEVAKYYGITKEQLKDISIEGIKKNWPMP